MAANNSDAEAEVACLKGDSEKLCAYFKRSNKASAQVVLNVARSLLDSLVTPGPGNRRLVFARNGRPPKAQPEPRCAAEALAAGQAIQAGMYLLNDPDIDEATQHILADLFDSESKSNLRLKFDRARRGNPRSGLRTSLYQTLRHHAAEDARAKAEAQGTETNWDIIYPKAKRELQKSIPDIKAGRSTIRAARAASKPGRK